MTFTLTHNLTFPQYKKTLTCAKASPSLALIVTTNLHTPQAGGPTHSLPTCNLHSFLPTRPVFCSHILSASPLLFPSSHLNLFSSSSSNFAMCSPPASLRPIPLPNTPPLLLGPLFRDVTPAAALQGAPANALS